MKRRLLSIVLVVAMVMSMAPVTALAADPAGDTIVLTSDRTEQLEVSSGNVTLDLNGYTLSSSSSAIVVDGDDTVLTIKDSSVAGTGKIVTTGENEDALSIKGGTVILEGGNLEAPKYAVYIYNNQQGTLVMNGGTITSGHYAVSICGTGAVEMNGGVINAGKYGVAVYENTRFKMTGGTIYSEGNGIGGNAGNAPNTIIIEGGSISAAHVGIYHPQEGELNISGGSITGGTAISFCGGTLNISGGTITGTGKTDDEYNGNYVGGEVVTGAAIVIENRGANKGYSTPVVSITDGEFVSVYADAVESYCNTNDANDADGNPVTPVTGFISGGTFSTDVSDYVAPGCNFAAGTGTVIAPADQKSYVSLGDSMTNGYGLEGYDSKESNGYMEIAPESYPAQVASYYGWNLTQLATSAMRAEDLRYILEYGEADAYPGDEWTQSELVNNSHRWGSTAAGGEEAVADNFQNSVREADVISVAAGNANFGVFLLGRLTNALGIFGNASGDAWINFEDALAELDEETKAVVMDIYAQVQAYASTVMPADLAENLTNALGYTMVSYIVSYNGVLDRIVELNPDAEIIIVGLLNTMSGFEMSIDYEGETYTVDMAAVLDLMIEPLNLYLTALPAAKQAMGEYEQATIYYAEVDHIDVISNTYEETYKDENNIIRNRFIDNITGFVFSLLPAELGLTSDIDRDYVENYEEAYLAQNFTTLAALATADQSKATSAAVYLAFENAALASLKKDLHASSLLGLTDLSSVMSGVMTAYESNVADGVSALDPTLIAAGIEQQAAVDLATLYCTTEALEDAVLSDTSVAGLLNVYTRLKLGDGLSAHPSAAGHDELTEAVIYSYANEWTAEDETTENIQNALDTALYLITEYYDEAYAYAYDYAVEAGYIDTAVATLEDIKTTLAGLTLDEATPEFQAELAAAVADAINTITELQNLLREADELDDATLQKALELVAALEKTLAHIDDLLVTAGEDTVDGLLNKWETEWKPALVDTIETIAKEAAEYLKEMLGEAYDAAVEFLSDLLAEYGPKAVQAAYDFLYNNPDKVVAFIKEYYDDAGAFLAKYHEEILMLIGFVANEYGDEIVDYVKNNYEDIIATMLCLLEEYGDEAGALLQVYADYLGWCQPVQDALDDLEAAAKGMKEDLLAALEALKAELEKLYAELEAAEEDIKAEIEEAIKAVEAAIEAIENAIEAVEGLIEAIEDLIAAVESGVHETIVEALENLKAALDAVNEAIAVLEEAVAIAKEVIDVVIVAVEVVAEAVEALTEVVEAIPAIIEEAKAIAAEIDAAINDMFAKIQQAIADIQAALYSACYAVISKCEVGEELVYVALGGATVANGGYVDAVDEYVGADRTINAGQAEGVAYADQLDYVLGHAADIANADLITYQMDANEMVKTLVDVIWSVNVANDYTSPDWSSFIDTEEVIATVEEVKAKVLEVKAELADYLDEETLAWIAEAEAEILAELDAYIDEEAIEEVRPYVESVAYSMVSYSVGVAEAAEAINTINPDAVVLLLGMYNTLEGTSVIMSGEEVDLGEFFTYVVEAVDIYDLVYAVISGNATVVEICEAPVEGVGSLDIDNVMSTMENAAAALAWMEAVENNYAVDHSYIAGQIESVLTVVEHTEVVDAAIEATCTEPGLTEGSHCSVCGKVFVAQEVIPATGHVAGEAVKENEVAAGCTTDGSYDTVVYCSVCGEELSRETTTVPATGHIDENGDGKCDNCGEDLGGSTPDIPSVPSTPVVDDKCDGGADCPSRAFSDLAAALDVEPTVWWHEATDYVIENGLMNGMGDGLFEPNTTTTRAMIVTTLYRIEGAPAVDAESAYTDVAEGMWYTDAIIWATENGIVKGYGDDTFGPMDNVTREQIATIFHRYAEYKGMATSEKADLAEYTDAAEVSGWALEAMQWANECGLMIGRTETTLVPAGETTRAEMAMLLFRWCEEIAK